MAQSILLKIYLQANLLFPLWSRAFLGEILQQRWAQGSTIEGCFRVFLPKNIFFDDVDMNNYAFVLSQTSCNRGKIYPIKRFVYLKFQKNIFLWLKLGIFDWRSSFFAVFEVFFQIFSFWFYIWSYSIFIIYTSKCVEKNALHAV